jgi:hypothetical protein
LWDGTLSVTTWVFSFALYGSSRFCTMISQSDCTKYLNATTLHCLPFFDIWLPITLLASTNFSYPLTYTRTTILSQLSNLFHCNIYVKIYWRLQLWGGEPGALPPKIGKDMIFLRKMVIFHTKYPKFFRASLRLAQSYPLHPAFNEKSKNHCGQLQWISSTLYSLTSINCVVTVRGVADCRNLTDVRTDIKCLSNGVQFFYTFLTTNSDYNLFVIN